MPRRLELKTYAFLRDIILITKTLAGQLLALEKVLKSGVEDPGKAHIACQSALEILEGIKFTHSED